MITLGCVMGKMCDVPLPQFILNGAPSIRDFFWTESGQDIDLEVDSTRLSTPLNPGLPAYGAFDLHQATLSLTHNPPPPTRSERVAVLFANAYAPNVKVLGMMFDRGFATWDDPNNASILTASPREGCAIFLQAILELRKGGFPAQQEAFYTTVHEMGHLFNLQHSSAANPSAQYSNVMATSKAAAPYVPPYRCIQHDRDQLHACSSSAFVWPGGAKFQDTGDWSGSANSNYCCQAHASGLQLRIETSCFEFWKFEPIELVVELSAANGNQRRFSIPDTIDPGYSSFVIWLKGPNGETKRYKSPRHYCSTTGRIHIGPDKPFKRDISIFGQSGGYTFDRSGIWQIWAEFDAGSRKKIRSNVIDVLVRSARNDAAYENTRMRMSNGPAARLLYHRLIRPRSDGRQALLAQLDEGRSLVPKGGIEYAVGRAMLSAGPDIVADDDWNRGLELLRRARDKVDIGEVQRDHADRLIERKPKRPRVASPSAFDWGDEAFLPLNNRDQ